MTTTYNKSITTDFGGSLKSWQFHNEIVAETKITPTLSSIDTVGDVVNIIFTSALSAGEQTTLDGLIAAHAPVTKPTNLTVSSDTLVTITSANDVLLSGMTVEPADGKYNVVASGDTEVSSVNKIAQFSLYYNDVRIANTLSNISKSQRVWTSNASVTVSGGGAIEVRWCLPSTGVYSATSHDRRLTITEV